ncbi:MAG: FAD-dependent oxidoreductase [Planctomycetota bacterium]|jgi:heterodisulfide reductase subunit A
MPNVKRILVIGAGIAGATVAERLSRGGLQVHLVEKQPEIGGHTAEMGCKATDVCLRCNVCVARKLLRHVAASDNIRIHTRTKLTRLETGENGNRYTVILKHEPTFIDRDRCTGCQECVSACPEKCIVKPKVGISPAVPVVHYSSCRNNLGKKCTACEQICPFKAINMGYKQSESRIDIDSVVVATGYEPYDPAVNASYGYEKSAGNAVNIITGIEAERQLAAGEEITRPSDGQRPKRIAFIQCVGSRSQEMHPQPEDTNYCSTVCCGYALRMAQLMKYQSEDAEVTIFYMDIQNFGKGFDEFYKKCKGNMTFIRSRPYEITHLQGDKVRVKYTPPFLPEGTDSQVCEQEFDLVILAIGIRPASDTTKLAESLLLPVDEQGFLGFKNTCPLPALERGGIFAVGACEGPKDIESCMAQAEAVSAAIISEV